MAKPVYAGNFEATGLGGAHIEAVKLIGMNKRVLDVGCSSGYLSKIIKEQLNCIVDGVEIDPDAAILAKEALRHVYIGSIEDDNLLSQITDSYDVILFMDVLEHLKDPFSILVKVKKLLSPNGFVIASIPNVANWRIRFSLLFGRFEYEESGLLDKSHLRFFTLKALKEMFFRAGYKIDLMDFTLGAPPPMLGGASRSLKDLLKILIKRVTRFFPGFFANQFILKAVKNV